jgi:hypothetical protein
LLSGYSVFFLRDPWYFEMGFLIFKVTWELSMCHFYLQH